MKKKILAIALVIILAISSMFSVIAFAAAGYEAEVPPTGVSNWMWLYCGLALVAAVVLVILWRKKKK